MVPVVAFMNLKGGVGKTTLAANVARAIAGNSKTKILIIDLDSQCNLSQIFFHADAIDNWRDRCVYQCFEWKSFFKSQPGPSDLKVTIFPGHEEKNNTESENVESVIDIIVGSSDIFRLAVTMPGLATQAPIGPFSYFIKKAKSEYDLIILDTNPSATFTTICALEVSNFLVAPITMDTFSLRGIQLITDVLSARYEWLNNPRNIRILPNRIQRTADPERLAKMDDQEDKIRVKFPRLSSSIMVRRIHESKLLQTNSQRAGFAIDQKIWPFHKHALANVKTDLTLASIELLNSIKEAHLPYANNNYKNSSHVDHKCLQEIPA